MCLEVSRTSDDQVAKFCIKLKLSYFHVYQPILNVDRLRTIDKKCKKHIPYFTAISSLASS